MRQNILWPVGNLIALLVTVAVNGLANVLPFNGITTGDVINRDPVAFLPANWVFSIWGLIYLALMAFVVYSFVLARREAAPLGRISALFILSCAANCLWLISWHWGRFPLSMLLMLVLLGALIAIYVTLDRAMSRTMLADRLCLVVPFSIYLGWICVATIANAAVTLHRAG
jgi:benzodiazapine receptor